EAGGPRPLEVVRLTVARHRDEPRPGNVGADAPGDLVTVDARQADVDQRDVGPEAPRLVHAGVTVARLVDLVTEQVEQVPERLARVVVVLDDEDLVGGPGARRPGGLRRRRGGPSGW